MEIGQVFDNKYKILDVLGEGGMSKVYLAENIKLGTLWAIKRIEKAKHQHLDLLAEPNMLKKLNHPALPRIFDIFEDQDYLYMIEDYIKGKNLEIALSEKKVFEERIVVQWGKQICDVLHYLHTLRPHPIVYRDLKPGNIMLSENQNIKIIDFGIAREYKHGSDSDTMYMGTRGYAAPEQYGTAQSDARTDIYSLGVLLYHLVTGKNPNDPPYELRPVRQLNSQLSQGIEYIIEKCTRLNPEERYQSVQKLLFDINRIHEFDAAYRKNKIKQKLKAVFFIFLIGCFSTLIYAGVQQLTFERQESYTQLVQQGISLIERQEFQQAVTLLRNAVEVMPERVEGHKEIGRALLLDKKYDQSIQYLLNEAFLHVGAEMRDGDLYYLLGTAFFEKGDYQRAASYFERSVGLAPGNARHYRDLAVAYAKLNQLEKASAIAAEIEEKHLSEEASLYISGEIYYAKKQYPEAVEQFIKALNTSTDEQLLKRAYVSTAQILGNYPTAFRDAFEQQIALLEQARVQLKEKNDEMILELLGEAYFNKAMDMGKEDDRYESYMRFSADHFLTLIEMGYQMPYLYRNIAIIYQYLGELEKSEVILEDMQALFPDEYRAYAQMALLYAEMENQKPTQHRNYDATLDQFEHAVNLSPNGHNTADLQPLINLVNDLKEKGW